MIPFPSQLRKWADHADSFIAKSVNAAMPRVRSSRTAAWTLLIHPQLEGKALLIVNTPSASVFVLSRFFSEVHLLVPESLLRDGLEDFYNEFCKNVRIHCWKDAEHLVVNEDYSSLIVENALLSFGVVRTRKLCECLEGRNSNFREAIIISRNPFGLGVIRERLRLKSVNKHKLETSDEGASWKAIHNLLKISGASVITRHEMYPNASAPREILGPWSSVPVNRQGRLSTFLAKLGIMQKIHNGYLYIGTVGSQISKSYLAEILDRITAGWGNGKAPEVIWLRCLETGSVILDLRNNKNERAILKVMLSAGSAGSTLNQRKSLVEFVSMYSWASPLLPTLIDGGEYLGITYSLDSKVQGVSGNELVQSKEAVSCMSLAVAAFLKKLTDINTKLTQIDESYFENHVGKFVTRIESTSLMQEKPIQELGEVLRSKLIGKTIPTGFAHGDLNAKNVLFDESEYKLTGVIDWDSATYDELPLRDLIHFLVSIFRYRDDITYGSAIVMLAIGEADAESRLIKSHAHDIGLCPDMIDAMLSVCWLRYLADTLNYNQVIINDSKIRHIFCGTTNELIAQLRGAAPR
ncbi:MAG: phosphotransferase [Gammaproteobacteria bacterium]|nr:phosphotransferase [Gammaproteobacteria bacterium]